VAAGLEDRGAGLLGVRGDLIGPRLATGYTGEDQPADAAALRLGAASTARSSRPLEPVSEPPSDSKNTQTP
jgi:hypothetical protein